MFALNNAGKTCTRRWPMSIRVDPANGAAKGAIELNRPPGWRMAKRLEVKIEDLPEPEGGEAYTNCTGDPYGA